MKLEEAIKAHCDDVIRRQDALLRDPLIVKYVNACNERMKTINGRELDAHERRSMAQCMHNAIMDTAMRKRSGGKLFEATTEDSISFLGIQLPVIAALLPSLALNEVSMVQAMDRRIAAVFYMNILAGTTKGAVTAGDDLLHAQTGHVSTLAGRRYAITHVDDEVIGTGNGAKTGTVAFAPGLINLGNVTFYTSTTTRTAIATTTSAGVVSGTGISGTIAASGAYSITFSGLESTDTIYVHYEYQYDLPRDAYNDPDGVPEANVQIDSSTVTAIDFPIRAKYSIGAAMDAEKAHGINLEDELVKYLGGEIKFAVDQKGLDMIYDASISSGAATAPSAWNAAINTGQEWVFKKLELLDRIEEGSNNIFSKTLRAMATFIICGNNVARVIKQLPGDKFKPISGLGKLVPTGPMKIGELDGKTVVQNPFMGTNYYTLGYRGDNYLMAGFAYLPYIPLFTTPTVITSDLMAQKGFLSSAGFKTINEGMFCRGTISNLGTQATVS